MDDETIQSRLKEIIRNKGHRIANLRYLMKHFSSVDLIPVLKNIDKIANIDSKQYALHSDVTMHPFISATEECLSQLDLQYHLGTSSFDPDKLQELYPEFDMEDINDIRRLQQSLQSDIDEYRSLFDKTVFFVRSTYSEINAYECKLKSIPTTNQLLQSRCLSLEISDAHKKHERVFKFLNTRLKAYQRMKRWKYKYDMITAALTYCNTRLMGQTSV